MNVSYIKEPSEKTGKIKIINGTTQHLIDTSKFYKTNGLNNDDDATFTIEQKLLRCLDCMKDGSVAKAANISSSVPKILNMKGTVRYATLHEWEDSVTEKNKKYITNKAWTKPKKETFLDPMLENRVIFKESGLGSEYFITPEIRYVGNIATEVIDPAGRSPIVSGDIKFPENGKKLILDESFLSFFGFENCRVESTRTSTGTYDYIITIGETVIDKTKIDKIVVNRPITSEISSQPSKTVNVSWFQGNKEKNNFIAQDRLATTRIKRGLLLTKEMGDVLQVLIMFVWHNLNEKQLYGIVTCDKVVYLMCMLLEINCILTSADSEESDSAEIKGKKMRKIEIYEVNVNPLDKAIIKFNSTKDAILKENKATIAAIKVFRDINPIIKGNYNDMQLSRNFYEKIINDLEKINEILDKNITNTLNTPDAIDKLCKDIKRNFTFKSLFNSENAKRENNKKRKENLHLNIKLKNYTESYDLWKNKLDPSFGSYKYGKNTSIPLYILGVYITQKKSGYILPISQSQSANVSVPKSSGISLPTQIFKQSKPPTPPISSVAEPSSKESSPIYWKGGVTPSSSPIARLFGRVFGNSSEPTKIDIHFFDYPDYAPFYDRDEDITYNLYDELERQIEKCLTHHNAIHHYNEIYDELLHHFYLEDIVLYDNDLTTFIGNLLVEFKQIEQEIADEKDKNTSKNKFLNIKYRLQGNQSSNRIISTKKNKSQKNNKFHQNSKSTFKTRRKDSRNEEYQRKLQQNKRLIDIMLKRQKI